MKNVKNVETKTVTNTKMYQTFIFWKFNHLEKTLGEKNWKFELDCSSFVNSVRTFGFGDFTLKIEV